MSCRKVYWLKPGSRTSLGSYPSSSTFVCGILNRRIGLLQPQFLDLGNGGSSRGYLIGLVQAWTRKIHPKNLEQCLAHSKYSVHIVPVVFTIFEDIYLWSSSNLIWAGKSYHCLLNFIRKLHVCSFPCLQYIPQFLFFRKNSVTSLCLCHSGPLGKMERRSEAASHMELNG